jgi:hypothetical protein
MSRYQEDRQQSKGQKWKLPPNGQPISLFSASGSRSIIRQDDDSKHLFCMIGYMSLIQNSFAHFSDSYLPCLLVISFSIL